MNQENNVSFLKQGEEPKQSSVIWSDSLLYRGVDFPKYNPDDLIGRKGYAIYDKMMNDEQLKAVVRFRRDSISGREWGFEFDKSCTLSDEEKERRIAIMNAAIKNLKGSFKDGLNKVLASIRQGFSVTEKLYELFEHEGSSYYGIKTLGKKPYDSFYFVTDEFGDLINLYQEMDGQKHDIDMESIIHHVQNPDEDEHYGKSELREAYRAWFSKDIIIKFFNIHLERHASGFFWISETEPNSMPAAGSADHAALQNIVNNFQVKTGILLPAGLTAALEQPNNTDAFEKAINMNDRALAKALLMPNLMGFSEDGGVGSNAKSQTQLEAFLWILDSEAMGLEETLNEQLFRDLSFLNFGDDQYPLFTFKPLSKAMMQTIATTWGDLVEKKAVTPTDDDEGHLRNLMDFPPLPEDDSGDSGNLILDAAQITAMTQVIADVASGKLPWESGVIVLVASFPIDKEQAEELLKPIPKDKYDPNKEVAQVEIDPATGLPNADTDDGDGDGDETGDLSPDVGSQEDESVLGRHAVSIEIPKFNRQARRVNFSEIDRSSEIIINEGTHRLGTIINDIVKFFDKEIDDKQLYGKNTDPEVVNDLRVPSSYIKRLQQTAESFMRNSWELGSTQGKQEIEKAGSEFTRKQKLKEHNAKFGALTDDAASYFDTRAFTMAGKLSTGTMDVIKASILTGIKYSKTHPEIVTDIYKQLATYGYLNMEDAESALGQALEIANPTARLNTTVRTSSFEAINEARFSYFTDDSLKGFVNALEYSAILDSRTTAICSDMDNRTYPLNSDEWDKYRPPNHMNCRSILIPVIEGDEYKVTTAAHTAEPAQGFS